MSSHVLHAVWKLIHETFRRWIDDGASQMSAAIAFYAAFSMTPALLILISLVRLAYGGNTGPKIEAEVAGYVGRNAASLIAQAVTAVTDNVGIGWRATLLAAATMVIGASAVFSQALIAMDKVWRVAPRPGRGIAGVLRDRFWPFTMVVVIRPPETEFQHGLSGSGTSFSA